MDPRGLRQGKVRSQEVTTSTLDTPSTSRSISPEKSAQIFTHIAPFCMRVVEVRAHHLLTLDHAVLLGPLHVLAELRHKVLILLRGRARLRACVVPAAIRVFFAQRSVGKESRHGEHPLMRSQQGIDVVLVRAPRMEDLAVLGGVAITVSLVMLFRLPRLHARTRTKKHVR